MFYMMPLHPQKNSCSDSVAWLISSRNKLWYGNVEKYMRIRKKFERRKFKNFQSRAGEVFNNELKLLMKRFFSFKQIEFAEDNNVVIIIAKAESERIILNVEYTRRDYPFFKYLSNFTFYY
ncbi:unnamed protein product [Rhizophagus irregularis]|nr:unnamed protein product [Rhizophagus irregularis]